MELSGKVKVLGETETFGEKGFRRRNLVITTEEQYPQDILIEFTQDKCDTLNSYKVGDGLTVSINIRGREWVNPQGETKYFNSIQGWKINKTSESTPSPNEMPVHDAQVMGKEEDDDLPF